jgi:CDP-diacylglycerol--serine O-phosphatidyltransferase
MTKKIINKSYFPNSLTLMNLFSGFAAIIYISQNEFVMAAMFIVLGAIFDGLDGALARMLNTSSELGVQLDSLCDVVTFGVAPSFMLYQVYFYQFDVLGIILASLPALSGALRLARFNVNTNPFSDKSFFVGFPIPSGALTILSYVVFYQLSDNYLNEYKHITIIAVTIATSLAMVSTVKFDNVPKPNLNYIKNNPIIFSIFTIGAILILITKGNFLFPFMVLYLIAGSVKSVYNWISHSKENE